VSETLHDLVDDEGWARVLEQDLAVLYKHSTRCWASPVAMREVEQFATRHPDVPVYVVDVLFDRILSQRIALDTTVRHESPQVIVLRGGRPVWDASHRDISAESLAQHAAVVSE
jgi:bacillithiol system protein YtxJ